MTAEAAALSRSFRVRERTCTITIPRIKPGCATMRCESYTWKGILIAG